MNRPGQSLGLDISRREREMVKESRITDAVDKVLGGKSVATERKLTLSDPDDAAVIKSSITDVSKAFTTLDFRFERLKNVDPKSDVVAKLKKAADATDAALKALRKIK